MKVWVLNIVSHHLSIKGSWLYKEKKEISKKFLYLERLMLQEGIEIWDEKFQ
jgi:hypothetical protein